MTASNVVMVITTTCTALIAGLLYSYSCSVIPALRSLPDKEYIATMQSINKAIQNPAFFISFMGALILLPVCTYMHYPPAQSQRFRLLLTATLLYLIGVFGVTVVGNIPLNNSLEKFDLIHASGESIRLQRAGFEERWIGFHTARTVAAVLSLVAVIIGCISTDRGN